MELVLILKDFMMIKAIQFSPYKPVEMFDAFVPEAVLLTITEGVIREYKNAKIWCETEFNPVEADGLLPHFRRACIESMLCELTKRHPEIQTMRRLNAKRNCSHRLVSCGGVMLTQSLVEHKKALPREAIYREGYARDPQYYLFGEDDPPIEEAPLYGIITHMPVSGRENGLAAFVDIVFPDQAYKVIVGRIPLLDRFPGIVDVVSSTVQEKIPDSLKAKLRSKKEKA